MAKYTVKFKDNKFTGIYLSVSFRDGVGGTDSAWLAKKCKDKGLEVVSAKHKNAE